MREYYNNRQGLIDLIDLIHSDNLVMIEVGSFAGESAEIFVNTGKVKKIYCIDPWTTIINEDEGNTYRNMEVIEKQFDDRTKPYPQIIKCKGVLADFLSKITDKIDLVYVDGMHTYEGCMTDIKNTINVIKPRIAISGHDYSDYPPHVAGVKRAVNEVFGHPDKTFCDTSWIKFLNNMGTR